MKTLRQAKWAMTTLAGLSLLVGCGQSQGPGGTAGSNKTSTQGGHLYDGACDLLGTPYGGGAGTTSSPYLICTPTQLSAILLQPASHFALTKDLDFSGVDYVSVPNLSGTFDGGSHKILNWTNGLGGLFLEASGTIQNLVIDNATITGSYRAGLLVGTLDPSGQVKNVQVSGTVNSAYSSGGLVGMNYGTIQDSSANVSIAGVDYIGGFAGWNTGTISNCSASGSVIASGNALSNSCGVVGGLVAANHGGTIVHSYANVDVSGVPEVGGLVGENSNRDYSTTHTSGLISQSYATGSVTGTNQVGGLVGYNINATISNSYAKNSVAYIASSGVSAGAYGGLVGASGYSVNTCTVASLVNTAPAILNSYAATSLSVPGPSTGGLLGQNMAGTATNSFFDSTVAGTSTSAAGTAKTTAQMQTQSTYTGWDFSTVWAMPGVGYPSLR